MTDPLAFTVHVEARDDANALVPSYDETAALASSVGTPSVTSLPFSGGVWEGPVTIAASLDPDCTLTVTDSWLVVFGDQPGLRAAGQGRCGRQRVGERAGCDQDGEPGAGQAGSRLPALRLSVLGGRQEPRSRGEHLRCDPGGEQEPGAIAGAACCGCQRHEGGCPIGSACNRVAGERRPRRVDGAGESTRRGWRERSWRSPAKEAAFRRELSSPRRAGKFSPTRREPACGSSPTAPRPRASARVTARSCA